MLDVNFAPLNFLPCLLFTSDCNTATIWADQRFICLPWQSRRTVTLSTLKHAHWDAELKFLNKKLSLCLVEEKNKTNMMHVVVTKSHVHTACSK